MKSHELARRLLEKPDSELSVSIDLSEDDVEFNDAINVEKRAFGSSLYEVQEDGAGDLILLFELGNVSE